MKSNQPSLLTKESIHALTLATKILTADLSEAVVEIMTLCVELAKADYASVLMLDKDSQTLQVIGFKAKDPKSFLGREFPISEGLVGISARTKKTYISDDTKNDPVASSSHEDVNSEIAVPIITNGKVLGVLNLESIRPNNFNLEQVQILEVLTSMLATAIEMRRQDYEPTESSSNSNKPIAFVLMPFRDPFDKYYRAIIRPAIEDSGLQSLRADEIFGPTEIVKDIWKAINKAEVIIAELTTRNANVMYELGLSHAIGKSVIMLSQSIEDIPFDLRSFRCLLYDTVEPDWAEKLKLNIKKSIKSISSGNPNDRDFLKNKSI